MSNETESLSAILAGARSSLADNSWIDEITLPDEDGHPNDYARRVVPLDDVLAELDRIETAAERERTIARDRLHDLVRRMMGKLADLNAGYRLMLTVCPDAEMAGLCARIEALVREARAAIGEDRQ